MSDRAERKGPERKGSGAGPRQEHVVSRRRPLSRLLRRIPMLVWLLLVWLLLWGTYDAGTVIFGLVVVVLVMVVFPTPPIATHITVRPLRLVGFVALLAWDLVVSTVRVSWQALRYGPRTTAGIVAVRLVTDSDHITAMLANAVSLAPGQFVLQIDRTNRICYVYVLGMDPDQVPSVRRSVLAWERRVVRAVGTSEQMAMVENSPEPTEPR